MSLGIRKLIIIGIVIGEKDEWGKGYGTEVFKVATKYLKEEIVFLHNIALMYKIIFLKAIILKIIGK